MASVYGSFGASDRPATAPQQSLIQARKCADEVDFQSIVGLSRQYAAELEVKLAEKNALSKLISDAKRQQQKSEAVRLKRQAQLDKVGTRGVGGIWLVLWRS